MKFYLRKNGFHQIVLGDEQPPSLDGLIFQTNRPEPEKGRQDYVNGYMDPCGRDL